MLWFIRHGKAAWLLSLFLKYCKIKLGRVVISSPGEVFARDDITYYGVQHLDKGFKVTFKW